MPDRPRPRVTAVAEPPVVAICAGKDCRTRCEYPRVRADLEPRCQVVDVACVGICSGPVVVANATSDDPLVLAKLRSKKHRRDLLRLVDGSGSVSKDLAKRAVGKGKRKSTLKRVRKALDKRAA